MNVLEERLSKKHPQPIGLVAKKVRKTGTPSESTPPDNVPTWAVIKDTGNVRVTVYHNKPFLCSI